VLSALAGNTQNRDRADLLELDLESKVHQLRTRTPAPLALRR